MSESTQAAAQVRTRIMAGFGWIGASMVFGRLLQLTSSTVATHLLPPDAFGMLALCVSTVALVNGLTTFGLEVALIQRRHLDDDYLHVAWTFELLRNTLIWILLLVLAGPLARAYDIPQAAPMIRVLGTTFLIGAGRNMGGVFFRKELRFKEQFILDLIPIVVYTATVIVSVLVWRSIWAVIAGILIRSAALTTAGYFLHPFRPRLRFDLGKALELYRFGVFLLGDALLLVLRDQVPIFILAGLVSNTELGFYNRSMTFTYMILIQITTFYWRVAYPGFAHLHNAGHSVRAMWRDNMKGVALLALLCGIGVVLVPPLTPFVLTDTYSPCIPIMQWFMVQGIFLFLSIPSQVVFQAIGKPSLGTRVNLIQTSLFYLVFLCLLDHGAGVRGAAMAQAAAASVGCGLSYLTVRRVFHRVA